MASESASTTTGVGSTSALTIREIIPTNRTPEVWKDFNMCIMTNGQKKAQCKYCFHFFSEGSNTTLKNHITHPHCEVLKAQQNQNPEAGQTSMGRDGPMAKALPTSSPGRAFKGKGRKERWSLLLRTWLVHSLAHELAASPEATKEGPRPGKGRVAEW
ncbi:hypothetical protein Tco_0763553 [Tanacetum coccineum]